MVKPDENQSYSHLQTNVDEIERFLELNRSTGIILICKMLRDGSEIPESLKLFLADMLDPNAQSKFRADIKRRGKRGRPRAPVDADMGEWIRKMRDEWGEPFKVAVHDAMKSHGVKRHKIVASLRVGREIHDEVAEAEEEKSKFGK